MEIKSTFTNPDGTTSQLVYQDADSFDHVPLEEIGQSYGVCFYGDKIVIVLSNHVKPHWTLVGGSREPGESPEECLRREIIEESNMRVLSHQPIGFQKVIYPTVG